MPVCEVGGEDAVNVGCGVDLGEGGGRPWWDGGEVLWEGRGGKAWEGF